MKKTIVSFFAAIIVATGFYSITGASFKPYQKNSFADDSLKKICITTSYGDIKIKLYNETP